MLPAFKCSLPKTGQITRRRRPRRQTHTQEMSLVAHSGSRARLGKAVTGPPSLASVMRRDASDRRHPACRGGLAPQPQKNEAMEHEGQRNGEGRHHDQRIGRHEKVRCLERETCLSRRGYCSHSNCHDEVGDFSTGTETYVARRAPIASCAKRAARTTATMPVVTSPIPAGSANCHGRCCLAERTRNMPPATR